MWNNDFHSLRSLEFEQWKDLVQRYIHSLPGQKALREAHPVYDLLRVQAKLRETSEAKAMLLRGWEPDFGSLADLDPLLDKVETGTVLEAEELILFRSFLTLLNQIKDLFSREPESFPHLQALSAPLPLFSSLDRDLQHAFGDRGEILDRASPELQRIRRALRQVKEAIRHLLEELLVAKEAVVQEPLITIKNDRYVLPLTPDFRKQLPGIVHGQSGSGATLFVEPLQVLPLNNRLQELKGREAEEIHRILQYFSSQIRGQAPTIREALSTLGELDFIFARGHFSREFACSEPLLNEEGYIELRQARHPLLELALRQQGDSKKIVPIDLTIGKEFQTLVITGPNTGGKTVILKTVGLLTLMTLVGSHIPAADGSTMAVFTKIFADIGDEQSLQQNLSTFSAHMLPIISFLQEADAHSLILLDEVGAGTDPSEGAALGIAILSYLTRRGARTIVTTHHNALKTYAFSQEKMMNAAMEFDEATLQPTYRLQLGRWGQSNALAIAETLGMPAEVLQEAQSHLAGTSHWSDEVGHKLQITLQAVEKERKELQQQRDEVQHLLIRYHQLVEELEKERGELHKHLRREGEALLRTSQRELENLVSQLRQQGKAQQTVAFPKEQFQQIAERIATAFPLESPSPQTVSLSKGMQVVIPQWKLQGVITDVSPSAEVVEVECGGRTLKVPRTALEISVSDPIRPSKDRPGGRKISEKNPPLLQTIRADQAAPALELHLLGYRVEEALPKLEKYLDQALQAGLKRVRIIHGKGSGRLRHAVIQFLETYPRVRSFATCSPYEGGWGATAVELDT